MIQSSKPEQLTVKDIATYGTVKSTTDASIGRGPSMGSVWFTDSMLTRRKDASYCIVLQQFEKEFIELLLIEDFSDSIRNSTTTLLMKLRKGHKSDVNLWLEGLYLTHQSNDYFIMQLFRLISCFPYEFFEPSSLLLAGLGIHHISDFVKSEALSLIDHWGNIEVFDLLQYHEPPETPWLKEKYNSIRKSLELYAAIKKNR